MDVLLVAAKKDKIADYTGVISAGGPRRRSSSTSTPSRCRTPSRPTTALDAGKVVGAAQRRRQRHQHQHRLRATSRSSRATSRIGGNAYTEAVQKELNLPFEGAEDAKKGLPVDGVRLDDVRPVLHAVTENVLLEIQKTFDFFKATSATDRIDRIMLSGGASLGRRLRPGAARAVRHRSSASIRSAT